MSDEDSNEDLKRIKQCAEQLGEHYDAVHIFATRHDSGERHGTIYIQYGVGNWFTRYGLIREWVVKEEESSRETVRPERD